MRLIPVIFISLVTAPDPESLPKLTVLQGENIILPCQFSANDQLQPSDIGWIKAKSTIDVEWLGNLNHFTDPSGKYSWNSNDNSDFSLQLNQAELSDDGIYTCKPRTNLNQNIQPVRIKLEVLVQPLLENLKIYRKNYLKNTNQYLNLNQINTNFKLNSSQVLIVQDESNLINCEITQTKPASQLVWYKNGVRISSARITSLHEKNDQGLTKTVSTLRIGDQFKADTDIYRCEVVHETLRNQPMIKQLYPKIISKPRVKLTSDKLYNIEFSNLTLTCQTQSPAPIPNFNLTYKFYLDNTLIFKSHDNQFQLPQYNQNHNILINTDRSLNQKSITCTAENLAGVSAIQKLINNSNLISYGPEFTNNFNNYGKIVNEQEKISLNCNMQSVPPPKFTWFRKIYHDNGKIESQLIQNANQQNLVIENSNFQHAGYYFCIGENQILKKKLTSEDFVVYVLSKPRFVGVASSQEILNINYEVQSPKFEINFESNPNIKDIKITWSKPAINGNAAGSSSSTSITEVVLLNNQQHTAELNQNSKIYLNFVKQKSSKLFQKGNLEFVFENYKYVPKEILIEISNNLGTSQLTLKPTETDKLGKIAAILGGGIAGIILIIAAVIAGLYYNERQRKNRTYSPKNNSTYNSSLLESSNTESKSLNKRALENENLLSKQSSDQNLVSNANSSQQYASSLTSSQRDDGYITDKTSNTQVADKLPKNETMLSNHNSSVLDIVEVKNSDLEEINKNNLKVLPEIDENSIPAVPPRHHNNTSTQMSDLSHETSLNQILPPPYLTPTPDGRFPVYINRNSNSSAATGSNSAELLRSIYKQHFPISPGSNAINNISACSSSMTKKILPNFTHTVIKASNQTQNPNISPNLSSHSSNHSRTLGSGSATGSGSTSLITGQELIGPKLKTSNLLPTEENLYKTMSSRKKIKSGSHKGEYKIRNLTHV